MNSQNVPLRLEPLSIDLSVPLNASLMASLADHGVEFPCGGSGICGGCAVRVLTGSLPVTQRDREIFSAEELNRGMRLACRAHITEPLVLECEQWRMQILTDAATAPATARHGCGIAIDVGTTTIAAQLIDLASGNVLAVETELNPQSRFGADVMSRIRAALAGSDLTSPLRAAIRAMVSRLAQDRAPDVIKVVLVGNTVMHHLFAGCSVEPLSHVPFASPALGAMYFSPRELGLPLPDHCVIYFERCLGGFVGSDVVAGIIASGIPASDGLMALIDLGTNGEIAIGNRHRILCASTAAGPAFEAGSIRMGMRAVTGAISHVSLDDGRFNTTVIGEVEPRGICGSGLVDVAAAGLNNRAILPSGRIANDAKLLHIAGSVSLYQSDIRELQLAKGAIAAGFRLLMNRLDAPISSLKSIHLAGAFGNYMRVESAIRIGMIEAPQTVIHAAGNTALRGAKLLLGEDAQTSLATAGGTLPIIEHISLAAEPSFQDEFVRSMSFPESNP